MTDVARRTENLPVEYVSERPMRLVEWAQEAEAAHHLAIALCETPFAGAYKGNPGGATAAILKGAEVGLTPVTSLGSFDLIQGTPAPKALTLRALVQSHGHRVWIEVSTDKECIAKAQRRGEMVVHESRWTIARAAAMNLTSKANWKQQPGAMLAARATSEVCRLVAADVILGIGYSSEEILDAIPEPTTTVRRNPEPAKTTTARRAQPAAQPEPDLEPPTLSADEPIPADTAVSEADLPTMEPITAPQMKKLHALMNEQGMTDRALGLGFLSDALGREVESSKTLTKAEANVVISRLSEPEDPSSPQGEGSP